MRTRSSFNLPGESPPNLTSSNTKCRNRRRSKQPFILEKSPVDTMADQRTMMKLLRVPTEGYAEAIVVLPILAEQFEPKHSLINMMTSDQFFGLEKDNPHDHIRWFNKITSTINYKDVPNSAIKLMLFPFSLAGAAHRWLEKEPPRSILTWEDLVSKFINEFFPSSRRTNLRNEFSNFQQRDSNSSSSSKIAKLTHAVNQQTSAVTTTMTAILKQFQATPPLVSVKSVEEICVTCGGAHPYYQCLAADGNTFLKLQDNIQGYVSAAVVNYNQGNSDYRPLGELKSITTRSGIVLDGPTIPMPHPFINPEEDERVEDTLIDPKLSEFTIKVPPPLVQKPKPPSQINFVVHQRDPLHPNIPYPLRMHKQKQQEKDEKMLKALFSNKEKLLELANTPLNENCSAVILKKHPEKLRDPGKFLISCGFSELKCKSLADLGVTINLMPLSVCKNLALPELISTRMTLELANRAICTSARIARDVFVLVGKFAFPAVFVTVDYESDPRVPLILGRPFLRIGLALIDVHGEEMILCDGDERLPLNMRHDTSSYSNQPQKESINMINIYDDSCEDFLEDLFATNHLMQTLGSGISILLAVGTPSTGSGNSYCQWELSPSNGNALCILFPTEVKEDIFDPEGDIVLDPTKDLPPPHNINPFSGSTTSSSPNHLLKEFADELALVTFPPRNDELLFDIKSDLKEIEYFLNHDPIKEIDSILEDSFDENNLVDLNGNLVDTIPEMFTDEHALNYSSPPLYDEYNDDLFEVKSDTEYVYDDPFDSKGGKIKEYKLLIDELDLPKSKKPFEVNPRVAPDKNVKKLAISHASLILEDFDPPLSLYELPFLKEVPGSETLHSFSSKNEEKVFKPEILTSKVAHTSLLLELSHQGPKVFKVIKILKSPMEIFPCLFGEDICILDVLCIYFYPL
uniref:Retrotransposon gag domain-containing protein n=1 Tax=Tanacetum cinerariifolium TaxID=118510 RepID=A0A6L2LCI4_TANCI|nr:hypothetical protein [Tanacetum cinerariifolium]